jgi:hypothetical protein
MFKILKRKRKRKAEKDRKTKNLKKLKRKHKPKENQKRKKLKQKSGRTGGPRPMSPRPWARRIPARWALFSLYVGW